MLSVVCRAPEPCLRAQKKLRKSKRPPPSAYIRLFFAVDCFRCCFTCISVYQVCLRKQYGQQIDIMRGASIGYIVFVATIRALPVQRELTWCMSAYVLRWSALCSHLLSLPLCGAAIVDEDPPLLSTFLAERSLLPHVCQPHALTSSPPSPALGTKKHRSRPSIAT